MIATRLACASSLCTSIAHEIKQPIATARNNASAALNFLEKSPPDVAEVREAAACIVKDTDRASDIVDRIRSLTKKMPPRSEVVDQSLVRDGILKGIRCPRGGYELARDRRGITANDILRSARTTDAAEDEPHSELVVKVGRPTSRTSEHSSARGCDVRMFGCLPLDGPHREGGLLAGLRTYLPLSRTTLTQQLFGPRPKFRRPCPAASPILRVIVACGLDSRTKCNRAMRIGFARLCEAP
jgi:His Kinase A (phospho-acceptor) domain